MNGDILTQLDFGKMIAFSEEHDFELTIGYRLHASESPFGVLTIEGDHVTGIVEKPRSEEAISTGIYVLAATALDVVPDREFFTMPQLMSELIAAGRTVGAYHVEEFWLGLETVAKFEEALRELDGAAVHEVR
jgi:NDP-sugar pyrophosphorylase family protein